MAPFPAWMGGFPYRSSSGSLPSSTSKSTMTIHIGKLETTSSRSIFRRRSPRSPFGYFEDVKVKNTYHFDPDHKITTRSPIHTHNRTRHAPKPKLKLVTPMTEFTTFFQREWKCINRGRWGQSKIAVFSSGPVLVVGSVILLSSFLDRRDRRKSERQRAAEKEGKDWGDGFQ
jgi:hypothetical protein